VASASIQEDVDDLWTNTTLHFSSRHSYDDEDHMVTIWDFGDGTEETTEPDPVHVYVHQGLYTVVLTVIDQRGVIDTDTLELSVLRNYGDTEVIIKAIEPSSQKTFKDPAPHQMAQVAVSYGGWVAYLCTLNKATFIEVEITAIGDRPVDIFLFREADFHSYKDGPGGGGVPSVAIGTKKNVTGEFAYLFTADSSERFYVVIDNRDWPPGTESEGPVDYYISISPPERPPKPPRTDWDEVCAGLWPIILIWVVPAIIFLVRIINERGGDRRFNGPVDRNGACQCYIDRWSPPDPPSRR
jgi:hypothetical protein